MKRPKGNINLGGNAKEVRKVTFQTFPLRILLLQYATDWPVDRKCINSPAHSAKWTITSSLTA